MLPSSPLDLQGVTRGALDRFVLVATSRTALAAMRRPVGCEVAVLDADMEGEPRAAAAAHRKAHEERDDGIVSGELFFSGGELTVDLRGAAPGARNHAFALGTALALEGIVPRFAVAAIDSDGIDGTTDAAGAYLDETILSRARTIGLAPEQALASHRTGPFFCELGASILTGPTGTNVNDPRAVLVGD